MQLPSMIGKYELLKFLGGGMSHVYRARDTVIERLVVVKILTDEASADPESKARFLHEAKIAGGIQHENIVSVFDYGDHGGRPYIVMEYLEGEDLRDAIREGHTGNLANRLRIAGSIAAALEYVHERGIIHRDIKPENVHIDKNGKVKLMDFGIAKTANLSLTRTGMAMGTPYYMAPEQVAGRATTPLIDIYAFGMLFFELLTGVRGIQGDTMEQLFYQIMNQPLDPAALENAGAPPAVRDLIIRCTAKAAEQRPQSMREVIEVVQRATPSTRNPVSGATTRTLTTPAPPDAPAAQMHAPPLKKFAGRPVVLSLVTIIGVIVIVAGIYLWSKRVVAVPGMIYYPGGAFPFGPDKKPVNLGPFYIDESEVSNADYAEFCSATGCAPPTGAPDLPVIRVTIAQARAYAQWKGRRLPTAQEWERAARGVDAMRYPWGNEEDPKRANLLDNPTLVNHALMPVRSFAKLPEYQMAGNAWEMIDTPVTPSDAAVAMFSTLVTPAPTRAEKWFQIRGGSYNTPLPAAVGYEYSPIPESFLGPDIGFRCAKSFP
ncbi:MAG: bifunctional serine/threonine-protein kinase/formylglycine-generating enzyme family protein [Acidobacteriota bacterium]